MASPGQAVVWGTFEPRKGGCCRFVTGTPASRNVCRVGCHFTFGRYFWRMRILDMHQSPRVVIDVNHWKRCGRPLPDTCCKKGLNWDFLPVRPGRDGAPQRGTSALWETMEPRDRVPRPNVLNGAIHLFDLCLFSRPCKSFASKEFLVAVFLSKQCRAHANHLLPGNFLWQCFCHSSWADSGWKVTSKG